MFEKIVFSKTELKQVLSNYELGVLKSIKVFTGGSVQTNIFIKTAKGKFVFRYYRQGRPLESVMFEVNLIRHLKKYNYPCPAPTKNRRGKYVGVYNKKPYVVFEYIEGKHLKRPGWKQKKELIKRVAELQNITRNYKSARVKYRMNYGVALCRRLAKREAGKINTNNSREKLRWYKKELANLVLPGSLPKGICHCDFHFSNVLYKNGRFNALIDFDDANYTYLIFDLVCLIEPLKSSFRWHNWKKHKAGDNVFDFKEAKRVVTEYMRHRPLSNLEKKYMFDVYKLSILLDCIWYFKRGKVNNFFERRKIEYLNELGREGFYKAMF